MPPPILADYISAVERELKNYSAALGSLERGDRLVAGLRHVVEGLKLLSDQQGEILGLVNQLTGRVEALEKREKPG
jgi:hypothetical protein